MDYGLLRNHDPKIDTLQTFQRPFLAMLVKFFLFVTILTRASSVRWVTNKKSIHYRGRTLKSFAEEEGFEPPVPLGTTVFKTAAFDHSAIPPLQK